jgi:oligosaccharide repeat unit polymerase
MNASGTYRGEKNGRKEKEEVRMKQATRLAPPTSDPGTRINTISWVVLFIATLGVAHVMAGTKVAALSCIVLASSYWIVKETTCIFHPRRITITNFWFVTYLAMIFFPAFFVYAEQEGPYRGRFLFAVESVLITVPLGWWLASEYFHWRRQETDLYFSKPVYELDFALRFRTRFWLLLMVSIVLTILYFRDAGTIPLLYLLKNPGDYMQLVLLREESFKMLDSPLKYFYALARGTLYPFLILVAFGCYLQSRQRRWLWLFIFTLILGVLFASLSLAKAPVALIVLQLGILTYLYRAGHLSRRFMAALLILLLAFPVVIIMSISSSDIGIQESLGAVSYRLLYIPATVVYYYYEVFPSQVPYLHGRSIDKYARLTGQEPFDTANYVGLYSDPMTIETVSANCAFIGDLNADFGLWGVLLGSIFTGFIMQSFHIYLMRKRKTVFNLACYSFLMVAFWFLHSTSLPIVLASDGALLALALTWLFENWADHSPARIQQPA